MIKNLPALLLLLGACDGGGQEEPEAFQGVVELDERVLGFEVGGRVESIAVAEGDPFDAGATLASLDVSLERTRRDAQAADVKVARAQVDLVRAGARPSDLRAMAADVRAAREAERLLQAGLDRQRRLERSGVSPAARTEELELQLSQARERRGAVQQRHRSLRAGSRAEEVAVAEARASAAEAALRATDERLGKFVLRAAEGGEVLQVHVEPGEVVSPGAPVVTVADLAHAYVDVFVPQGRLGGIRVGTGATLRVDAEKRRFHGRVEYVSRRTEFTPRYLFSERERPNLVVRVRVRVEDPDRRLHAGVPAFATFETARTGSGA